MERLILPSQDVSGKGFASLAQSFDRVVQTYSNVHRGTGAFSLVSTALYEHSRQVILAYLNLDQRLWQVIFCSPARAEALTPYLPVGCYQLLTSRQFGLPIGLVAMAVHRSAMPSGRPFETGGGTIKLVSPDWVVWADAPDRFEAGTPPIINAIMLACTARLEQLRGKNVLYQEIEQSPTLLGALFEVLPENLEGASMLAFLRQDMVDRAINVPIADGQAFYTNLDNAASKPAFGPVARTFWRALALPANDYAMVVEKVKTICARFLGAPLELYEIIFTSNTSEAINLAARSLLAERSKNMQPLVVNSLLDHHSNELPWRYLPGIGHLRMEVDENGLIDLARLEALLKAYNQNRQHGAQRIILVALCGASNVIGTINELKPISSLVHRYGARLLVDGAQWVAHRKIDLAASQVDYLAFSAHKVYAPFGSGALVVRRGLLPADQIERMSRSGEENVAGIAALGEALLCLEQVGMQALEAEEKKLTSRLVEALQDIPGIQIYGITDRQLPVFDQRSGVVSFCLKQVPHNLLARELSEQGIGVRNGCFCTHLLVKRLMQIHPLRGIMADIGSFILPGFTALVAPGLVRVSLGIENDGADIERLADALQKAARQPRRALERWLASIHNGTPNLPPNQMQQNLQNYVDQCVANVFVFPQD